MAQRLVTQIFKMTSLEYLKDTFRIAFNGARVLSVSECGQEAEGKRERPTFSVILDSTIFHPQGGGHLEKRQM
jgi:Ser-tRNA(Ala) deacylase AlaX